MFKMKSRLVAGAVFVALSATTSLAPQPVASAAPSFRTDTTATMEGRKLIKTGSEDDASKRLRNKAGRVVTMVQKAKSKHGRYDYRKMNKYDNTHVKWRREAAAYLIWLGKDVTHLSRAERKKVEAFKPKRPYAKVKFDDGGAVPAVRRGGNGGGKVCTGWTGYLITDSVQLPFPGIVKYWIFLNSCHTNALQYAMALEAGAFALFGAFFPPSIPVVETIAFLEGVVGVGYIELAQSNSGLNSILVTKDVARLALVSQ